MYKFTDEKWGFLDSRLGTRPCSSVKGSPQSGLVKAIEADGHHVQVLQGIHPQYMVQFEPDQEDDLAGLFVRVLGPFGTCHAWRMAMHQGLRDAAEVLVRQLAPLRSQMQLYRRLCEQATEIGVKEPVAVRQLKELEAQLAEWERVRILFEV